MDWLTLALVLGPSLLQMLFGGKDQNQQQQTQETTTTVAPSGYQSPTLGLMDLLTQGTLGRNLSLYGGAGMPGGTSIVPSFMQDFLNLIGSEYFNLQNMYKPGTKTPARTAEERRERREERWTGRGRSYGDYAGR